MSLPAAGPARARERVVRGALPRIAFGWAGKPLSAGVTIRPLGSRRAPAAPPDDRPSVAFEPALLDWAAGRFEVIAGAGQVHGARLFRADGPGIGGGAAGGAGEPRRARADGCDGLYAAARGVLLTIVTADCVPVLLYAPDVGAFALLHAGWRGVAASILPGAIAALGEAYGARPERCLTWLGPAVGPCCYPVGEEVVAGIRATSAGARIRAWVRVREGGSRVDLRGALAVQAEAHGVPARAIVASRRCTACEPELFHSYRRDGAATGRLTAFAGIASREPVRGAGPGGGPAGAGNSVSQA